MCDVGIFSVDTINGIRHVWFTQAGKGNTMDKGIDQHYAAFVAAWFDCRGYCVMYDVGYASGALIASDGRLKCFSTWIEAYDAAALQFSEIGHPAAHAVCHD